MKVKKYEVNCVLTGKLLRMLRALTCTSSKDFAEKILKIQSCKLSRIENGVTAPDLCVLKAYSSLFDIPVGNLVIFVGEEEQAELSIQMMMEFLKKKGININLEEFVD